MNPSVEKNLILGDSHARNSFDLSVLKGWENKGSESEPYSITYLKLKFEIKRNKVDSIILTYGYHNISQIYDDNLLDHRAVKQFEKNSELLFLSRKELKNIPLDKERLYKILMKEFLLKPIGLNDGKVNELSTRMIKNTDDVYKPIKRHYKIESNIAAISSVNKAYLEEIIKLALAHDIKVILLNTPLHKDYLNRIPKKYICEYKSYTAHLTTHKNIIFMDYSSLNLKPNHYRDFDHLNKNGAELFTRILIDNLNQE